MFIEHVMQLYRVAVPIVPWFHFLSDGLGWIFSAFLLLLYFLFKVRIDLLDSCVFCTYTQIWFGLFLFLRHSQ